MKCNKRIIPQVISKVMMLASFIGGFLSFVPAALALNGLGHPENKPSVVRHSV